MLESGLGDARRLNCRARTRGARTSMAATAQGAAGLRARNAVRGSGALPAQAGGERRTAHPAAAHASARLTRRRSGTFSTASGRLAIREAPEQGFGQLTRDAGNRAPALLRASLALGRNNMRSPAGRGRPATERRQLVLEGTTGLAGARAREQRMRDQRARGCLARERAPSRSRHSTRTPGGRPR